MRNAFHHPSDRVARCTNGPTCFERSVRTQRDKHKHENLTCYTHSTLSATVDVERVRRRPSSLAHGPDVPCAAHVFIALVNIKVNDLYAN